MKTYKVTLEMENTTGDLEEREIEVDADVSILDAAEEHGIELPYSCRAGSCSTCLARILSGTVGQSDQTFLDKDQLDRGYVLTCVAYPTSDLVLLTDREEEFFKRT